MYKIILMIVLIIFSILFFMIDETYSVNGFDKKNRFKIKQRSILPAEINGNVLLTEDNSPYIAESDIIITAGSSLTASEGVEIHISEGKNIYVYGEIHLEGTIENPIYIMSNFNANRWGVLCCYQSTGASTFYNVFIKDASRASNIFVELPNGRNVDIDRAAISSYEADLTLDNVTFDNNIKPLSIIFGNALITNCTFLDNNLDEHISLQFIDGALIEDCELYNCLGDAIDFNFCNNSTITGCKIFNCPNDDGFDVDDGVNNTITNNIIYNCADNGISIGFNQDAIIENNLIVGCKYGIGMKNDAIGYINNNTLFDNDISIRCNVEDMADYTGNTANIINCIFSNSRTNVFLIDSLSSCIVSYSLCDTEILSGVGNIMADPQFISSADNNFNLKYTSPCINMGDPNSPLDPDGTRADIGAYYFNLVSIPNKQIVINEINYNSSIYFDPDDWIEFYNPQNSWIDISAYYFTAKDNEHTFVFPDSILIEPNGYLILCRDKEAFHTLFPEVDNYIGDFEFDLSSDGEMIRLYNSYDIIIDSLTYDDEAPWPIEPDGNGPTLELIRTDLDNRLAENWIASLGNGTPGISNVETALPTSITLEQNYPNPFNKETIIPFYFTEDTEFTLYIYNIAGSLVRSFNSSGKWAAGSHYFIWDCKNNSGEIVSSGIYLYKLEVGNYNNTGKMIFLK